MKKTLILILLCLIGCNKNALVTKSVYTTSSVKTNSLL
jgi:outer membrane lipoprotein SlyB